MNNCCCYLVNKKMIKWVFPTIYLYLHCAFQQRCILIGCLSQGSFMIGCLGQGCSLIGCLSHLAFHGSVNSITLLHLCLMHLSYMFIMFMLEMMNNSVLFVIVFILELYVSIICNMWVPVFLTVAGFFLHCTSTRIHSIIATNIAACLWPFSLESY